MIADDHTSILFNSTTGIPQDVTVIAIPCVGDAEHLLHQMMVLDAQCEASGIFPSILASSIETPWKRRFGHLHNDHLHIWRQIQEHTNIEFDLIYTPRAMEIMLLDAVGSDTLMKALQGRNDDLNLALQHYEKEYNIIYYHCGGLEGNPTQLNRLRCLTTYV